MIFSENLCLRKGDETNDSRNSCLAVLRAENLRDIRGEVDNFSKKMIFRASHCVRNLRIVLENLRVEFGGWIGEYRLRTTCFYAVGCLL